MDLKGTLTECAVAAGATGANLKAGGGNEELKPKDSQSPQEPVSAGGHAALDAAQPWKKQQKAGTAISGGETGRSQIRCL